MAHVTGPFLSLTASGTVAGLLTGLNSPAGPVMRKNARQKNVPSPAKQSHRVMFAFLQKSWAGLTLTEQATWSPAADIGRVTNLNTFCGYNLARWRNFLPPLKSYPGP